MNLKNDFTVTFKLTNGETVKVKPAPMETPNGAIRQALIQFDLLGQWDTAQVSCPGLGFWGPIVTEL